jgi:hypothetical protein
MSLYADDSGHLCFEVSVASSQDIKSLEVGCEISSETPDLNADSLIDGIALQGEWPRILSGGSRSTLSERAKSMPPAPQPDVPASRRPQALGDSKLGRPLSLGRGQSRTDGLRANDQPSTVPVFFIRCRLSQPWPLTIVVR